ncbi:hypothetical protein BS47DRAFT_1373472 [Hydnum rufescens UP504]|uniref:Arginine biosynthesis bifunctional protein ArgJ, mitochondrial n=1 Tax=Hydnum rufescens UP504 TaxID=1448309 RepID=A0A9P6APP4_9AGAM|nr:hypothetical protein BS47DRAFT_1373472 [Hydnum rufescens UP504]
MASTIRSFHRSSISLARSVPSKAHHHQPIDDALFPHGYRAQGIYAGVKKNKASTVLEGGAKDLALITSTTARTSSAGCFTRNVFKAAPVQVSTQVLRESNGRANTVVVEQRVKGMADAWEMVQAADAALTKPLTGHSTLVMSTGVIGQLLPISQVLDGIRSAATSSVAPSTGPGTPRSNFADWEAAAQAFMTTDTFPKLRARSFDLPVGGTSGNRSTTVRIAGIDKGAGMIHPNMGPPHATLLGLIATDAAISPRSLQSALTFAVSRSFNSISVDGDMSTNDTILALANGAADPAMEEIDEETHPEAYEVFKAELTSFAIDLAKLVVHDGEGATKFVTITVKGAPTYEDAHHVASSVSTSSLVKCALYGEDANWGRILCAVGYAPLSTSTVHGLAAQAMQIDPNLVSVSFIPSDGSLPLALLVNGEPEKVDEERAKQIVSADEVTILIDLGGVGDASATYWTCDLSHEYVTINGDYRT